MRNFLLAAIVFFSLSGYGQIIADPALSQISFTDLSGNSISDTMALGYVAQLNVPIKNLDAVNDMPAGSCKIKIGLGSKIILDPTFDLNTVSTSQYFLWTSAFIGGQVQLTGELIANLPADFSSVAKFNVIGNILEYSTITTNFLVTNHNTQDILSDENPSNNTSFRQYKIIPPTTIPVNFNNFSVSKDGCDLLVYFDAENEINVSRFDIEVSKDGINFTTVGSLTAANRLHYRFDFPIVQSLQNSTLYIRVKSVDADGRLKFTPVKMTNGLCNSNDISYIIYPNPIINTNSISILIKGSVFKGTYNIQLFDVKGRLVSNRQMTFNGQQQFSYAVDKISSGQYILKLTTDSGIPTCIKIQKYN